MDWHHGVFTPLIVPEFEMINSSPMGTGEDVRRTGEGRGEYFNNQVAEILSRSRKVRTQIPNKTKMVAVCKDWPAARTGAKGQRPPQGRVGAGLASPAGLTFKKSCSLFQTCNKFFQFSQSAAVTKF